MAVDTLATVQAERTRLWVEAPTQSQDVAANSKAGTLHSDQAPNGTGALGKGDTCGVGGSGNQCGRGTKRKRRRLTLEVSFVVSAPRLQGRHHRACAAQVAFGTRSSRQSPARPSWSPPECSFRNKVNHIKEGLFCEVASEAEGRCPPLVPAWSGGTRCRPAAQSGVARAPQQPQRRLGSAEVPSASEPSLRRRVPWKARLRADSEP